MLNVLHNKLNNRSLKNNLNDNFNNGLNNKAKMDALSKIAINGAVIIIMAMSIITSFRYSLIGNVRAVNFYQHVYDAFVIFIAWQLLRRRKKAWLIFLCATALDSVLSGLSFYHAYTNGYIGEIGKLEFVNVVINIYVMVVLIVFNKSFKWKTAKISASKAFIPLLTLVFIFVFGYIIEDGDLFNVWLVILGYGDTFYEGLMCFMFWVCCAATLYLAFKPKIFAAINTTSQRDLTRQLLWQYGQNPMSYLTLEEDKLLYFGKEVEGVVPYGVVGDVIVVLGDPVCSEEDFAQLLLEFKQFCVDTGDYQCIFLGATDKYWDIYNQNGYNRVKSGEEARFNLDEYKLAGGKMAKMRMNINHATKAGLTTLEYKPLESRDLNIEKAFDEISKEWISGKTSGQLGFTLGTVGLENPMDRRYFYAQNNDGKIVAFNVFIPFGEMDGMKGMYADITRRLNNAPGGVTEKIMFDAFMQFKDEGIKWGSMGLAPLANVRKKNENQNEDGTENENEDESMTSKVLEFVYEKCNGFYGFKSLYHAKEKYNPSEWLPGYFVFSGKALTPQMAWAVVMIENPGGMKDYIVGFLRDFAGAKKNALINSINKIRRNKEINNINSSENQAEVAVNA